MSVPGGSGTGPSTGGLRSSPAAARLRTSWPRSASRAIAGSRSPSGVALIDLSAMKAIDVDPERRIARVEPGVLLGELDAATQPFGLATPTGNVSMTGVAGLTLGGGLGWIARLCGAACDNLLAADVVTADGSPIRASEDENPDLLWVCVAAAGTSAS
jgi:FAD/FMN-containing dehydrogenase